MRPKKSNKTFSIKIEAKKPKTKKGAKGIWDFKVFFERKIKIVPKIAPKITAKNIALKMFGQPKNKAKDNER